MEVMEVPCREARLVELDPIIQPLTTSLRHAPEPRAGAPRMTAEIGVRNCFWIPLQTIDDGADGSLAVAEVERQIRFPIRRVYTIWSFGGGRALRGCHAHKRLEQVLLCVNGSFELNLDDGVKRRRLRMKRSPNGVYLGPRLWHTMRRFSDDCVIIVLASERYRESDYIRDYEEFRTVVGAPPPRRRRRAPLSP